MTVDFKMAGRESDAGNLRFYMTFFRDELKRILFSYCYSEVSDIYSVINYCKL